MPDSDRRSSGAGGGPGSARVSAPAEAAALSKVRGSLPGGRANARTVAALTENPGCTRRRVIDSAGIRAEALATRAGHPPVRGQSPFAIASGTMFEWRLKEGSHYARLFEVLAETFAFDASSPRVCNLNRGSGKVGSDRWLEDRARRTDEALAAMARKETHAPNLVDHPVLTFDLAGARLFLEPDALAFQIDDKLEVVEVKSYPVIDGQADPAKVAATAGQAAVYVLALRAAMQRLDLDPDLVAWSAILVAPRNFSRQPTAHRIPLRKKAGAIARVLASVPATISVLEKLPGDFTLGLGEEADGLAERTSRALEVLPALYVPECLASCDMAEFCRAEAIARDDVARIGRTARDALAGVPSLAEALRLARSPAGGQSGASSDVGDALREAAAALDRARAMAPASCGLARTPGRGDDPSSGRLPTPRTARSKRHRRR